MIWDNNGLDAEASKASFEMVDVSLGPGQPRRSSLGSYRLAV